jgi:predicted DNA-binding transcriptional regulator AlpA
MTGRKDRGVVAVDNTASLLKVITFRQLAEMLGVHDDTLRRMIARGEAPRKIQISKRRVGYRLGDVLHWQEQRLVGQ